MHLLQSARTWSSNQVFNTLSQRQTGPYFPDDIFKSIFLHESCGIFINISLKFVPNDQINYTQALVQIMAWYQPGAKQLSEPMMAYFIDTYQGYSAKRALLVLMHGR